MVARYYCKRQLSLTVLINRMVKVQNNIEKQNQFITIFSWLCTNPITIFCSKSWMSSYASITRTSSFEVCFIPRELFLLFILRWRLQNISGILTRPFARFFFTFLFSPTDIFWQNLL